MPDGLTASRTERRNQFSCISRRSVEGVDSKRVCALRSTFNPASDAPARSRPATFVSFTKGRASAERRRTFLPVVLYTGGARFAAGATIFLQSYHREEDNSEEERGDACEVADGF